jgi:hypothetical protein
MSFEPRESIVTLQADLAAIRRPQMLLRTARHGLRDYNRATDLRRILRVPATPRPGLAVVRALIELEALNEEARSRPPQESGSPWRAARHVEVLIALIAEAALMAAALRPT